jgi:hypothetical protein
MIEGNYDGDVSYAGLSADGGDVAGFDYSKVRKVMFVTNSAFTGNPGHIKWDYLQVGPDPITVAAIPASLVGEAIAGVNMAEQVCSCITPAAFSAEGLPVGITIDPATGVISGTPTTADDEGGIATVTMTADDGKQFSVEVPYGTISIGTSLRPAGSDAVIDTHYYTPEGIEIARPSGTGIYIVRKTMQSGKVIIAKELINR